MGDMCLSEKLSSILSEVLEWRSRSSRDLDQKRCWKQIKDTVNKNTRIRNIEVLYKNIYIE